MIQMSKGQKAKGQQGLPLWYFVNIFSILYISNRNAKQKQRSKRKSGKAEKTRKKTLMSRDQKAVRKSDTFG